MNILMKIATWQSGRWKYDLYNIKLDSEDLLYELEEHDTIFIKGVGEVAIGKLKYDDHGLLINAYSLED